MDICTHIPKYHPRNKTVYFGHLIKKLHLYYINLASFAVYVVKIVYILHIPLVPMW